MATKHDSRLELLDFREIVEVDVQAWSTELKDPTDESGKTFLKLGHVETIRAPRNQIAKRVKEWFGMTLGASRSVDTSELDKKLQE